MLAAPSATVNAGLKQALQFAVMFALIKLAIQVGATIYTTHIGYGYFRDEFYYIICGRFLDWGYVDQSPMVALQARLAILLFGKSLVGIRMFSALAGAAPSSSPASSPGRSAAAAPRSFSPCSP